MSAADDDKALNRQEQIWAGLYGPSTAAELVAKVRTARQGDADAAVADLIRAVEPEGEDDLDEAGTMRPI